MITLGDNSTKASFPSQPVRRKHAYAPRTTVVPELVCTNPLTHDEYHGCMIRTCVACGRGAVAVYPAFRQTGRRVMSTVPSEEAAQPPMPQTPPTVGLRVQEVQ